MNKDSVKLSHCNEIEKEKNFFGNFHVTGKENIQQALPSCESFQKSFFTNINLGNQSIFTAK